MAPQVGTPSSFRFPTRRALLCGMERTSNNGLTAWKARLAALARRYPRVARAAGWALLGGAVLVPGWHAIEGLSSLDTGLDVEWSVGPFDFGLLLILYGLFHSGALGIALRQGDHSNGRRAAGFALLAMFWFNLGLSVGVNLAWRNPVELPESALSFLVWFAGLLTMTAWVALAGLVTVPALRSRSAIVWLLGPGAVFAALVGVTAIENIAAPFNHFNHVLSAWGAVQAAAFSLALPPRKA